MRRARRSDSAGGRGVAARRLRLRASAPLTEREWERRGPLPFSPPRAAASGHNDDDEEAGSSVLSDFDVLNDVIQEFLLDSDSDASADEFFFSALPFLHCAGRRRRRRHFDCRAPPRALSRAVPAAAARSSRGPRALLPRDKGLPHAPLCVVLDLDETIVSARRFAIEVRPHVRELLDACHDEGCEVVVWSAGSPAHVNAVVRAVAAAAQRREWYHHLISRHRRWYGGAQECVKDLAALGRPLRRVVVLENSPRSVQRQPQHTVLVEDYIHPDVLDESLRIFAGVVRRLAEALRNDDAAPTSVPQQLMADAVLAGLTFASDAGDLVVTMGLSYSPRAPTALRSYGGEHPLQKA